MKYDLKINFAKIHNLIENYFLTQLFRKNSSIIFTVKIKIF